LHAVPAKADIGQHRDPVHSAGTSTQKRQTQRNETGDHNSDGNQECPPDIVVCLLLLEPLRFGFIIQPTKRCLPFLIGEDTAGERVAEGLPRVRSEVCRCRTDALAPFFARLTSRIGSRRA